MIKFEHIEVFGEEAAIRGMRNPMNSWEKSDSSWKDIGKGMPYYEIGKNDLDLMKRLCNAGTDHRKFMRMINVTCDITAPLYWWEEFDTYKVGTVADSCSTMHKIQAKEFTLDDFSCEHIDDEIIQYNIKPNNANDGDIVIQASAYTMMINLIGLLNVYREMYLDTKDKKYWRQMIQLLLSSYNQKRTVQMNYEVLANIYKSRKNHKLDEWRELCRIIKTLPYSELITGGI